MTKQETAFNLPRKDLIGTVQKGAFALLLLLLIAAVGLYKFLDLEFEARTAKQSGLTSLMVHTSNAERYWYEWLVNDYAAGVNVSAAKRKENALLPLKLLEVYTHIDLLLSRYQQANPHHHFQNVKPELAFLEKMTGQNSAIKVLKTRRLFVREKQQIRGYIQRAEEQGRELAEQQLALNARDKALLNDGEWGFLIIFGGVAVALLALSVFLVKRLGRGFQHLHVVLEKHQQGSFTSDQHYKITDEFTDLGHLFDSELSSREFTLSESEADKALITQGLSRITSAFLIADAEGDVKWLSHGFSELWQQNASLLEPLFEIDPGLDGPLGERLPETILNDEHDIKLSLHDGRYSLVVERLMVDADSDAYLVLLPPLSQLAEIEVLRKSLELMVQGAWQYPIRLLRDDSPFQDFAVLLEKIRHSVVDLFDAVSSSDCDKMVDFEITKLQQIKTLLTEKINDNCEHSKSMIPVDNSLPESLVSELDEVSYLTAQFDDVVLVGYELLLQRLMLVEKDVAGQAQLLSDVDRCLNEVRAGVLASLSASEGDSDQIRRRFSIDLDHDISSVQKQIYSMQDAVALTLSLLESDHSVGSARLKRAQQSANEMKVRIDNLLVEMTRLNDGGHKEIVALTENTDGLEGA
ncbi:hypothetical protein [Marinomonas pollencensis]|uniref:Uncharacterized protein n=1 Tax=Marinomonas pollencensis TaxID=491954 RepID=A0A3E0DJL3_9GAMM|nr:hypothetical protein [Marinomonas pollencensis]REG82933.1 hypothetical protein DFP81_107107 [Marinomonas pollencensis]